MSPTSSLPMYRDSYLQDAIAAHPNLHTFHLLNFPYSPGIPGHYAYGISTFMPFTRATMVQKLQQHFANEMFQRIMQMNRNSKIKVLAISPDSISGWYDCQDVQEDSNKHRYPHYYYVRGPAQNPLGHGRVVGVPMEFERCMADMSASTFPIG